MSMHTFHLITACAGAMFAAGGCRTDTHERAASAGLIEDASVTVYPVVLLDQPNERVAEVVGIFLERGGMQTVEVSPAVFTPDPEQDAAAQAESFGRFVAEHELTTDYALFASYLGTHRSGFEEVRGVMVDARGNVVWQDAQKAGDEGFDRIAPKEPMTCCVLLAERVREPLGLEDPMRADAPEGNLARRMRGRSGVPSDDELSEIEARCAELRAGHANKTVLVYPALIVDEYSAEAAERLAALINERGLLKASVASEALPVTHEPDPNQQRVLWTAARSAQALIRKNPPDADYALVVDFLMDPESGRVGGVHTFVLEADGDWAIVDYQNSHHDDFNKVRPHGVEGCCELAVKRLAGYLD